MVLPEIPYRRWSGIHQCHELPDLSELQSPAADG